MRKFFLAVLVVLVAMIAAVLVGPGFVDWNDQKGRLVAEFERLTGRRLTIAGDIDLALLPAPTLSAALAQSSARMSSRRSGSVPRRSCPVYAARRPACSIPSRPAA